ncbi:NAD(P)-dependent alcohol dehydrogenase [Thiomicrolovo sp. ZZH C-3]
MLALCYTRYGPPERLFFKDIEIPVPKSTDIVVKVHATTVNRTDCATIRAKPFFARIITGLFVPAKQTPGTEFAGVVVAAGAEVEGLTPGDRVFGFDDTGARAHAQYLCIDASLAATIPNGLEFAEAAAGSEGAHYAQNFINKVPLKAGDHVLVNGATGAIGSASVQLLSAMGVKVTATCAAAHTDTVKSLGAERVIDYTRDDFTRDAQRYDYVFDTVGKSSFFRCYGLLNPGGAYISSDLGFLWQNLYLPLITPLLAPFLKQRRCIFPTPYDVPATLTLLRRLRETGKFRALIDRRYAFEEIIEAYRFVEQGHKVGNVVITIPHKKQT